MNCMYNDSIALIAAERPRKSRLTFRSGMQHLLVLTGWIHSPRLVPPEPMGIDENREWCWRSQSEIRRSLLYDTHNTTQTVPGGMGESFALAILDPTIVLNYSLVTVLFQDQAINNWRMLINRPYVWALIIRLALEKHLSTGHPSASFNHSNQRDPRPRMRVAMFSFSHRKPIASPATWGCGRPFQADAVIAELKLGIVSPRHLAIP